MMGNVNPKYSRAIKSPGVHTVKVLTASEQDILSEDPDIMAETAKFDSALRLTVVGGDHEKPELRDVLAIVPLQETNREVPLRISGNTYQTSEDTAQLLREIGGSAAVRRMTNLFYLKCFQDPHLDQFIRSHDDPHFLRLADWIVEKMGGEGDVWTRERADRARCPVAHALSTGAAHVVHDRTSAHVAAWWSPKRAPRDAGRHFGVHDCRAWMRLMFWSAREAGLLSDARPAFGAWFVRFIAHFVRVYERAAPAFARESARWSADPARIAAYLAAGRTMPDVTGPDGAGVPLAAALAALPPAERNDSTWPYG